MVIWAAYLHALLSAGNTGFQLALIGGAPWGHLTMGGQVSGALPVGMRVGAGVSALLIVFVAVVVLAHAGVIGSGPLWGQAWLIWLAVGVAALTLVLNSITQSVLERRLWVPIAVGLLATSLTVALGGPA